MKERCEYMQEVNSLCKDVERETAPLKPMTTPLQPTATTNEPQALESELNSATSGVNFETAVSGEGSRLQLSKGPSGLISEDSDPTGFDGGRSHLSEEVQGSSPLEGGEVSDVAPGELTSPPSSPSTLSKAINKLASHPSDPLTPSKPVVDEHASHPSGPSTPSKPLVDEHASHPSGPSPPSKPAVDEHASHPSSPSTPSKPADELCSGLSTPSKPAVDEPILQPTSPFTPSKAAPVSQPTSPSTLNPELADLATEVKDLNVRFSNVCMQAKHHYAALSKVLTASIERHSSMRSSKSKRSKYAKITCIGERNDKRSLSRHNSTISEDAFSVTTSLPGLNNRREAGNGHHGADGPSVQPLTTSRLNIHSLPTARALGVAPTSKASVLATASPKLAGFSRSASISTGTDIDAEIRSSVQAKYRILLRSKSVQCDQFSDTEPRSKKRPKSAVIIQPNADGETALVSEVQLRNSTSKDGGKFRRRSMEITLASLAKTGLLSPSNRLNPSPAASPAVYPVCSPYRQRKRFGSLSTLQAGERTSVVSIDSLDPRTMISGQLQHNSYDFNSSIGSDLTTSMTQISDLVPERKGAREPAWNGNQHHVGVGNGLQPAQRSASMDTLALNSKQGQLGQFQVGELCHLIMMLGGNPIGASK